MHIGWNVGLAMGERIETFGMMTRTLWDQCDDSRRSLEACIMRILADQIAALPRNEP